MTTTESMIETDKFYIIREVDENGSLVKETFINKKPKAPIVKSLSGKPSKASF